MLRVAVLLCYTFLLSVWLPDSGFAHGVDSVSSLSEGTQLNYVFNVYNGMAASPEARKLFLREMAGNAVLYPDRPMAVLYQMVKADSLYGTDYEHQYISENGKAVMLAQKNGFLLLEIVALCEAAKYYYFKFGNQEKAFELLSRATGVVRQYKSRPVDMPEYGRALIGMSTLYTQFSLFDSSLNILQQGARIIKDSPTLLRCYFALGYNYVKRNNADDPVPYYQKGLDIARGIKDTAWTGDLSFRIGDEYFKKKEYDKAIPYLDIARLYSRDFASPAPALLELAEINLLRGNKSLAALQLQQVRGLVEKGIHTDRTDGKKYKLFNQSELYRLLSLLERSDGHYRQALIYNDSFAICMDSFRTYDKRKELEDIAFHQKIARQRAELEILKVKKSRALLSRNSVIVVLLLVLLTSFQTLRKIKSKRDQDKKLYEVNLQNASKTLHRYVENLQDKNRIIEQFSTEIDELRHSYREQGYTMTESLVEDKQEVLSRLQCIVILTENDWNEFKVLFEKVYPHFFMTLKDTHPELTQSEIRLLALTKLHLSTREISNMLGISIESVRQSRWRLKKKILLSEGQSIESFLDHL